MVRRLVQVGIGACAGQERQDRPGSLAPVTARRGLVTSAQRARNLRAASGPRPSRAMPATQRGHQGPLPPPPPIEPGAVLRELRRSGRWPALASAAASGSAPPSAPISVDFPDTFGGRDSESVNESRIRSIGPRRKPSRRRQRPRGEQELAGCSNRATVEAPGRPRLLTCARRYPSRLCGERTSTSARGPGDRHPPGSPRLAPPRSQQRPTANAR